MTKKMIALADGWREISLLSDDEVESVIREVAPDILIDLAGHTGQSIRLRLFQRRLAPVQISWLGYPNTTGINSMDYRITDSIADPIGIADKLHSEKLVRIADCFLCYKPPQDAPEVSLLPAIKNGYITFGSFNMLPKVQDGVIKAWSQILHNIPDSKLFLKNHYFIDDATVARMLERFKKYGIMKERLIIKRSDPDTQSHLAQYENIDVALDTFPYNGTTTTCEALWMGVPVISKYGDRHASRVGLSLLTMMGHEEFANETDNDYIASACRLASDLELLVNIRKTLRTEMLDSKICDDISFVNKFESFLMSTVKTKLCLSGNTG
jgi:predicted O-linked N-acetylglucosamine transferase (SPINDLY family)